MSWFHPKETKETEEVKDTNEKKDDSEVNKVYSPWSKNADNPWSVDKEHMNQDAGKKIDTKKETSSEEDDEPDTNLERNTKNRDDDDQR